MRTLLIVSRSLFGIYAFIVWLVCIVVGGALVLILPGLALRRRPARRALRVMLLASGIPYRFSHLEGSRTGPPWSSPTTRVTSTAWC